MLLNVIEGPYLRDLLDQPAALQRCWEDLSEDGDLLRVARHVRDGRYRRIVLTGMGSSQYSLYPLHLALLEHGLPSYLVETAELLHYQQRLLESDSLIIVVSQSGQSAEIVALADAVRGRAPLIALTNTAASPLASSADVVLHMHAGPEATVACKTYVCSLLVLEWLGALLTGQDPATVRDELSHAAPAVERYLAHWREHVASLAEQLVPVRRIFITGRGRSLAAAENGGLILKEAMRFHAEGMSCPAFRHGPFEVLRDEVLVIVMAGDSRTASQNRRLADDITRAGGRAAVVDSQDAAPPFLIPESSERVRPILEILPVQMITLALGIIGGRQPGSFALNTKVTTTE